MDYPCVGIARPKWLSSRVAFSALTVAFALFAPTKAFPASELHSILSVGGRAVRYDTYGSDRSPGVIIFLHGASGPSNLSKEAEKYARFGLQSVVLHYFDSTKTHSPTDDNYRVWVQSVESLVAQIRSQRPATVKISLFGVSLGASVALAAGSQQSGADAIIDWSGSLPDYFFTNLMGMPPLLILHGQDDRNVPIINAIQLEKLCRIDHFICRLHIYPDQGHAFSQDAVKSADELIWQFLSDYGGAK